MGHAPNLEKEKACYAQGHRLIAGLDEAGRGSWAGPVVAGAVILPLEWPSLESNLEGVRDSKKLSPQRRAQAYELIKEIALATGVGIVPASEIDDLGIIASTRKAMGLAIRELGLRPDFLLIDALFLPEIDIPQSSIIKGDDLCLSIAAASILAKVTRDKIMRAYDGDHSGYNFSQHKGYGTKEHLEAVLRWGPSSLHRLSYAPMKLFKGRVDMKRRKSLGDLGERLAAVYLERQGYLIRERNYRCPIGEIDLVATEGDCLVFVEVRTRRGKRFGSPEESMTLAKQQRLIDLAESYLAERGERLPLWRIDLVAVEFSPRGILERVELVRNAVVG